MTANHSTSPATARGSSADDPGQSATTGRQAPVSAAAAVFAGIGVPLAASSPAAMGVALVLAIALAIAAPGRGRLLRDVWRGASGLLGLAIVAVFVAWLPAVFGSEDAGRSAGVWGRMVVFVLVATVLYQFLSASGLRQASALRGLVLASLVSATVGLVAVYAWSPLYSIYRLEGAGPINAAQILKYYGSAAGCLIPVVAWAGWRLGGRWRWAGLTHVPAAVVLIVAVDSNAGLFALIVAVAVGGLAWLAARMAGARMAGAGLAVLVFGVVALLSVLLARLPDAPDLTGHTAPSYDGVLTPTLPVGLVDAHRQQIWAFSLDAALDSPVIGRGIDVSNYLPGAEVIVTQFNQAFIPSHPHSWFLEVFLETGALGLLVLIGALLVLLWRWVQVADRAPLVAATGIALFAGFWVSSMLNFSIWAAWWQGVFLILTAIVLAAASASPKRARTRTQT